MVIASWQQLVPIHLLSHTRLDSFSRGTLKVTVDSSSARFELDRLLRSGLERQLISAVGGQLRRVKLAQAPIDPAGPNTPEPTRDTASFVEKLIDETEDDA